MGREKRAKKLLDYDDVFTDVWNNLYFGGHRVLFEQNLSDLSTVSYTHDEKGELRERNRDVRKKCSIAGGKYEAIFTIESQMGIDYTMPLRVMGYEYASYEAQMDRMIDQNRQQGRDAGSKRLFKDQRIKPELTGVLYFGEQRWKVPVCLQDMLELSGDTPNEMMSKIRNYPMNLIQIAYLDEEERVRLTSDLRVVAEYLACKKDKDRWKQFLTDSKYKIRHVEALLELLWEISKDQSYFELLERIQNKTCEKEEWSMCEIAQELKQLGREEGRTDGLEIITLIQEYLRLDMEKELIVDKLEEVFSISHGLASQYYDCLAGH